MKNFMPQTEITFGIITENPEHENCQLVVESIRRQQIKEYQIVIVGGTKRRAVDKMELIPFDESVKKAWITRKKNLITQNAQFEQVVYLHDYICLESGWYEGLVNYGNQWDVMMTRLRLPDGRRYRDYSIFPSFHTFSKQNIHLQSIMKPDLFSQIPGMDPEEALVPFNISSEAAEILHPWLYISGAYWMARRKVMLEFPLDERLGWGEGEDIDWSERIKKKYKISFNDKSTAILLKTKDPIFREISSRSLQAIVDKGRKSILRQN